NFQANATLANPSNPSTGITHDHGIVRHVPRNHRTGADHGVASYLNAADQDGVGPNGSPLLHQGWLEFVLANDVATGVDHVSEAHIRSAEHVIFQHNGVTDQDIVLDLHVVADLCLAYIDVLPKGAICADFRGRTNVSPMPDSGSRADLCPGVDDRSLVREIRR